MKIYCMSNIHGFIAEFEYAFSLIDEQLNRPDVRLLLLGDYVHGPDSFSVSGRLLRGMWGRR